MLKSKTTEQSLDFYGRLLTIEQALRSLEGRLRGVEYRITYDDEKTIEDVEKSDGITPGELKQFLNLVEGKVFTLESTVKDLEIQRVNLLEEIEEAKAKIKAVEAKNADMEKALLEKPKQSNPGLLSIKIPVDITGLVAAASMLIIALLLATNNSQILREPAFSLIIAIAFMLAVAGKKFMIRASPMKLKS